MECKTGGGYLKKAGGYLARLTQKELVIKREIGMVAHLVSPRRSLRFCLGMVVELGILSNVPLLSTSFVSLRSL